MKTIVIIPLRFSSFLKEVVTITKHVELPAVASENHLVKMRLTHEIETSCVLSVELVNMDTGEVTLKPVTSLELDKLIPGSEIANIESIVKDFEDAGWETELHQSNIDNLLSATVEKETFLAAEEMKEAMCKNYLAAVILIFLGHFIGELYQHGGVFTVVDYLSDVIFPSLFFSSVFGIGSFIAYKIKFKSLNKAEESSALQQKH